MRGWAIDAGGSSTTAMLDDGTRWLRGSVNPASVGPHAADSELVHLFQTIAEQCDHEPTMGWLATATVDAYAPDEEVTRIIKLANKAGLRGSLVVSRDILPLLIGPPLWGSGVAVVCGTGSGFVASNGTEAPLSVGGCEYLGSDEGSAFALGLAGLRAAVRGDDGRGPDTALGPALAQDRGVGLRELARNLAAEPFPKSSVANLSTVVCRCWRNGDAVAGEVVRTALDQLIDSVRTARDRAGLGGDWSATLTGGVFQGCPEYAEQVRARVRNELHATCSTIVDDPVATVLATLHGHVQGLPDTVEGVWAWTRSLGMV